jgi:hypothetical protein
VHLLWGRLFTFFGGFSITVLRISVLTLGILGSCALLVLLRLGGASAWVALWGALTLVVNPLFLSQSFTYMTDITFCGDGGFRYCSSMPSSTSINADAGHGFVICPMLYPHPPTA